MDSSLTDRIQQTALQFVPFIFSVVFHEYGHGWMAKRWGDRTAEQEGRLTLNPSAHIDPMGTVVLPLVSMLSGIPIMFGWAKPVPINPNRFTNYKKGLFWVSFSGPGANVVLAVIFALIFGILVRFVSSDFHLQEPMIRMAVYGVQINFALAIFNLIPIPPLDGSRIVDVFLPYDLSRKFNALEPYSFFIIMGLLWTGMLSFISYPVIYFTQSLLVFVSGGA